MKRKILHIAVVLLLTVLSGYGQTRVHIFTRTITKEYAYASGDIIILNALQADVKITGWDQDSVSVELKLKAKNTNSKTAKKDVTKWGYNINKNGNEIILKNYFLKDVSVFSDSRMVAEYVIRVPENAVIHVSNSSGNVELKNVSAVLRTNIKYGNLNLKDFRGMLKGDIEVGDFECDGSSLKMDMNTKHTEINIMNSSGSYDIQSEYGGLKMINPGEISRIKMEVSRADILISKDDDEEYSLEISMESGNLNIDKSRYVKDQKYFERYEDKNEKLLKYNVPGNVPQIIIHSKYGNVYLN